MPVRRLANGALVTTEPERATGVAAVGVWWGFGSAHEREAERGAAHLFEHLAFREDPRKGPGLARRIGDLGGEVNAFTTHDEIVFLATLPSGGTEAALDALLQAALRPVPNRTTVALERDIVREELRAGSASGTRVDSVLFAGHPYERPVGGRALPDAQSVRSFLRRERDPSRLIVAVAGSGLGRASRRALEGVACPGRPSTLSPPSPARGRGVRARAGRGSWLGWIVGTDRARAEVLRASALAFEAAVAPWGGTVDVSIRRAASSLVVRLPPGRSSLDALGSLRETLDALARPKGRALERARDELARGDRFGLETVLGRATVVGTDLSVLGRTRERRPGRVRAAALVHESLAFERAVIFTSALSAARAIWGGSRSPAHGRDVPARSNSPGPATSGMRSYERFAAVERQVDDGLPLVAGALVWPGASAIEGARTAGRCAVIARAWSRLADTSCRPPSGAVINAFADADTLGLWFESPSEHAEETLARVLTVARAPLDADQVRRCIATERTRGRSDRARVLERAQHHLGLPITPSARPGSAGRMRPWARRWLTLDRATIALVGALNHSEPGCGAHLRSTPGRVRAPRSRISVVASSSATGRRWVESGRTIVLKARSHGSVVCVAHRIGGVDDPSAPIVDVLARVLHERVFEAIRERAGLAYDAAARTKLFRHAGLVCAIAACRRTHSARVAACLGRVLDELADDGPTPGEWERARLRSVCGVELGRERRADRALALARGRALELAPSALRHYADAVAHAEHKAGVELARNLFGGRRVCVRTR
jgi:zinc protease